MHSIGASIYLEVELENTLEETSVVQLELGKEFGGTGLHLEAELEKVFQLLWSLLYNGSHLTLKGYIPQVHIFSLTGDNKITNVAEVVLLNYLGGARLLHGRIVWEH